jgi:hypothetical protein
VRIGVVIPAAMGLGVLFSFALLFSDFYRRVVGVRSAHKRAALLGASTAAETIHGASEILGLDIGLHSRMTYRITAGVLLTLAAIGVPGATWNYFNPGGYVQGVAWIWAISSVAVVFFLFSGVATLHAAPSLLPWFAVGVTVGYAIRLVAFLESGNRVSVGLGILLVGAAATVGAEYWVRHHRGLPTWVWPLFVVTSLTTETRSSTRDNGGNA